MSGNIGANPTCAEAMAGGDKIVFQTLNAPLTSAHREALDRL
ncbi:transposase domain protein, partial [Escherichia coli P0299917.8]